MLLEEDRENGKGSIQFENYTQKKMVDDYIRKFVYEETKDSSFFNNADNWNMKIGYKKSLYSRSAGLKFIELASMAADPAEIGMSVEVNCLVQRFEKSFIAFFFIILALLFLK